MHKQCIFAGVVYINEILDYQNHNIEINQNNKITKTRLKSIESLQSNG